MAMRTEINVINDDIMNVPSDLLLLKHAGAFYGADEIVATKLLEAKGCSRDKLKLKPKSHVIIETRGAITPIFNREEFPSDQSDAEVRRR
jgi:hypothetical protein